jgi:hypothetical protein
MVPETELKCGRPGCHYKRAPLCIPCLVHLEVVRDVDDQPWEVDEDYSDGKRDRRHVESVSHEPGLGGNALS